MEIVKLNNQATLITEIQYFIFWNLSLLSFLIQSESKKFQ
jgi:hypothetical protein